MKLENPHAARWDDQRCLPVPDVEFLFFSEVKSGGELVVVLGVKAHRAIEVIVKITNQNKLARTPDQKFQA